MIHSIVEMFV